MIESVENFEVYEKRNLLVSNSVFQLLNMLEKQRSTVTPEEFAIKRFETLYELGSSKKTLTEEVVEKEFWRSNSPLPKVFNLYNSLYHQIKSSKSQKVLDQIYAGKSIFEIMHEEKITLDQVIFSLREIEMHMRRDFNPTKIYFLPDLRSTKVSEVKEDRRENLQDLVVGYKANEIARRRGYKKKSIDESLSKFRNDANISHQQQQDALNRVHTMNLGNTDLVFLDRLFRLAVKPSERQKFLDLQKEKIQSQIETEANMKDVFNQVYKVIKNTFEQLDDFKQNVVRMKISGQSNTQAASTLECKDYYIREAYQSSIKFMRNSIARFTKAFDKPPEGIDIYRYTQLTDDQEQIFKLYFQGNTTAQIEAKLADKSQSSILHFLGRIRKVLGLSVDQFEQARIKHLAKTKNSHDPKLKLLQTILPNHYRNGLGSNNTERRHHMNIITSVLRTLEHLHKVGGFRFSNPKYFLQHINEDKTAYEVYKAQKDEEGAKGETSVAVAIKSTHQTLQSVFDNLGESTCPKGIDYGKWLLLDKTQRLIYILREEGLSHQKIIERLGLELSSNAATSRVNSIYKLINA